jgi:hypothetical protein
MEIAFFIRPLVALVVLGFICLPARLAVRRWMPEGKLKAMLLTPLGR